MKKLPPNLREYLSEIGRKGGKKGGRVRASKLNANERSESARKAVQARWKRYREEKALEAGAGVEPEI